MPLQAPNLDDRTFDQILAQAKLLIPRYAPAWTNQSETDPGITLMELFAWMTEMMIYRLNQVPDRNYIKFLELLGHRADAGAAGACGAYFHAYAIQRADRDHSHGHAGGVQEAAASRIVFETDEALIALGAKLKALQKF